MPPKYSLTEGSIPRALVAFALPTAVAAASVGVVRNTPSI
jgi:hypothetical protein